MQTAGAAHKKKHTQPQVEVCKLLPRESFGEDAVMRLHSIPPADHRAGSRASPRPASARTHTSYVHRRSHHSGSKPRACVATGSLMSNTNVSVFMIPKVGEGDAARSELSHSHQTVAQAAFFKHCSFATRDIMRRNCMSYVGRHRDTSCEFAGSVHVSNSPMLVAPMLWLPVMCDVSQKARDVETHDNQAQAKLGQVS